MIKHDKSKIELSIEMPVAAANAGALFEGQALAMTMASGVGVAGASTGSSDKFLGFALNTYKVPSTAKKVEIVTVPAAAAYTVTLKKTPLSPSTTMGIMTAGGTALAYNASVGSGQFSVSGAVVTFNAAQAGNTYFVVYNYSPNADELQALFGDGYVYGKKEPSQVTNTVGVITRGLVFTDCFDPASNWYGTIGTIYTGASGTVTLTSGGGTIDAIVAAAPSVDFPYLGLYLK